MKKSMLLSCLFLLCTRAGLTMAQDLMPQDQMEQNARTGDVKSMEDRIRPLEESTQKKETESCTWRMR